jgi:hypothetical protein
MASKGFGDGGRTTVVTLITKNERDAARPSPSGL